MLTKIIIRSLTTWDNQFDESHDPIAPPTSELFKLIPILKSELDAEDQDRINSELKKIKREEDLPPHLFLHSLDRCLKVSGIFPFKKNDRIRDDIYTLELDIEMNALDTNVDIIYKKFPNLRTIILYPRLNTDYYAFYNTLEKFGKLAQERNIRCVCDVNPSYRHLSEKNPKLLENQNITFVLRDYGQAFFRAVDTKFKRWDLEVGTKHYTYEIMPSEYRALRLKAYEDEKLERKAKLKSFS